ncbi:hypothetical protein JTE88_05635 [Arcanobacterium phocisimile]|uniref:SPW repeat-containing protein n=1 Tax=Arcanobacterium phocisimile TaxID=1302235 RepID=A0ABX7IFF3_9ACTO|nr:hypothetical protein [Arcanobacterium phocisimile]QRV01585.1 hypothetical protein JTE88_05635 [Arcanobacterium phocisimile]
MRKYEHPLMIASLSFVGVMAILGWWTILSGGGNTTGIIIGLIASLMIPLGFMGWHKDSLNLCATAALGAGLLFPTTFGLIPMILGFILFTLIVALDLLATFLGE